MSSSDAASSASSASAANSETKTTSFNNFSSLGLNSTNVLRPNDMATLVRLIATAIPATIMLISRRI